MDGEDDILLNYQLETQRELDAKVSPEGSSILQALIQRLDPHLTPLFILSPFPHRIRRLFLSSGQALSSLTNGEKNYLDVKAFLLVGRKLNPVLLVEPKAHLKMNVDPNNVAVLQIRVEGKEHDVTTKLWGQTELLDYKHLITLPLSAQEKDDLRNFAPGRRPLPEHMKFLALDIHQDSSPPVHNSFRQYEQAYSSEFYTLVVRNDYKRVKLMLNDIHHINPNQTVDYNTVPWTALDHAVYWNNPKMVKLLCSVGGITLAMTHDFQHIFFPTHVQQFCSDLSLRFWIKAKKNNLRSMRKMIAQHSWLICPDIAIGDSSPYTPLDLAIFHKNQEMAVLLCSIRGRILNYTLSDLDNLLAPKPMPNRPPNISGFIQTNRFRIPKLVLPILEKAWDNMFNFFYDTFPSRLLPNELEQYLKDVFSHNFFFENVLIFCSSKYFGGFVVDPFEVAKKIENSIPSDSKGWAVVVISRREQVAAPQKLPVCPDDENCEYRQRPQVEPSTIQHFKRFQHRCLRAACLEQTDPQHILFWSHPPFKGEKDRFEDERDLKGGPYYYHIIEVSPQPNDSLRSSVQVYHICNTNPGHFIPVGASLNSPLPETIFDEASRSAVAFCHFEDRWDSHNITPPLFIKSDDWNGTKPTKSILRSREMIYLERDWANWSKEKTFLWAKTITPEEEAQKLDCDGATLLLLLQQSSVYQALRQRGIGIGFARKLENAIKQLNS